MAIPRTDVTMHHTGNALEDIPMGFKAEDFAHLAGILDGLYSNTIAAPIREYSTNATDSHILAGQTRPIEIFLPTDDRLEFVVQDFGLGMSVDDLRETYSQYGRSDKRGTNAVAGQLGLGSKSGLSYAEAFTVSAVKGGVKVVAMVTKDEHGLGVIKVLDTVGTTEPNGVRITIPVDRYDVDDFRREATNLFQFWTPGSVLIDGNPPEEPSWLATALRLDEDTWVVRNDAGLNQSYVVMQNVAYPVADASYVGTDRRNVSRRFVARLNIGDVDFVPSREEVKHTRHTDATLAELHAHIEERFKHALDKAMASSASHWAETMLKTLWMDRNLSLRAAGDHNIWTFNPSISWGRKAQAHNSYSLAKVAQGTATWVITGFTAKNLSPVARERLVEFAGSKASFIIIPDGVTGTNQLDGRPNVAAWAEIVGSTTKPKADKAARGPKVETRYTVLTGADMTATELDAVSGKVLYLNPGESASSGNLDATVVRLYSINQTDRIKRLVPAIVYYYDEAEARRKAARKALTAQDSRIAQARTLPAVFQALDPAKVDDPELADHIRLSKTADTATMSAASKIGVSVPHQPLDYSKRYPLLDNGRHYYHTASDKALNAERLIYVNAKWANLADAEAAKVAS